MLTTVMLMLIMLAINALSSLHAKPDLQQSNQGQRINLLFIADELIASQRREGKLPSTLPI